MTPRSLAAFTLAIADLLLHAGAKVNAANDLGVTPLDLAAENASPGMIGKLLNAGADPNVAQTGGLTPLMIAAHTGNIRVGKGASGARSECPGGDEGNQKYLVDVGCIGSISGHREGADRGPRGRPCLGGEWDDRSGFTPLRMRRHRDCGQDTDRAAGVKVNETGSDGTHPFGSFAIVRGQGPFALFLLDQGADPNGGLGGIRALHAAAASANSWLTAWNAAHPAGGAGAAARQRRVAAGWWEGSQSSYAAPAGEGFARARRGPERPSDHLPD